MGLGLASRISEMRRNSGKKEMGLTIHYGGAFIERHREVALV